MWRYPVKSMGGQRVTGLDLGPHGAAGDRAFALADARTGKVLTAKRLPVLLLARARLVAGGGTAHGEADPAAYEAAYEAEIVLPTGVRVRSSDPAVDLVLSAWLERPVHLLRAAARDTRAEEWGKDRVEDYDQDGTPGSFELPGWGLVDEAPLHIVSRDVLRAARRRHPEGAWEVRRFRPNIVLEGPGDRRLIGHDLALGTARVQVTGDCRRCVMITQPQHGLAADRGLLRAVTAGFAAALGVYADVTRQGTVSLGDPTAPDAPAQNTAAQNTAGAAGPALAEPAAPVT
ncbi:MOSC N-terminal beta barrel domain-containing protein [Spirillospora sp. NPDC047279]|uniref:MOSC domain-containing protein n=1 Tax=Spirillospora sp. NPDC047279 TaxID=3155478 RepID=UPI0033D92249